MDVLSIAALIVLSYLVGGIPMSIIIGKLFFRTDIREHGSGNAGATNAFRVFGWKAGTPAILIDAAKGVFAVLVIATLAPESVPLVVSRLIAGVSAVAGHIWTVFARFRGGKGVATAAGVVGALHPLALAIAVAVFALTLVLTGYVSAGSVIGAVLFPVSVVLLDSFDVVPVSPILLYFSIALAVVIIFTHRRNITRLFAGNENRFEKLMVLHRPLRAVRRRDSGQNRR